MKKLLIIFVFLAFFTSAYGNKSSVTVSAPSSAKPGEIITITINVRHNGNNFFHHTSRVYIKINGKEIAKWKYPFKKENFSKSVTYKVSGPVSIEAMATCNLHGSMGKRFFRVKIK